MRGKKGTDKMNRLIYAGWVFFSLTLLPLFSFADQAIIVGHTCTDLSQIPDEWIQKAKQDLHIAYQHTSHGSQLPTGMAVIESVLGNKYDYGNVPNDDTVLDFHDYAMASYQKGGTAYTASDLGYENPSGANWWDATRAYLDNPDNIDVNVIMWSWCDIASHNMDTYINNMEALIAEYGVGGTKERASLHPVQFVFITGHANGGGENDSSDSQNRQIREHCLSHNRILFDFADIENYDPNGNYYLDKNVDDALYYNGSGGRANWATEYLTQNDGSELYQLTNACGGCAHSPEEGETSDARLNCVLKGRAVWYLMAKLAGWGGSDADPYTLSLSVEGQGQIVRDPVQQTYSNGAEIRLTATADSGWVFSRWEGDLTGSENPVTLTMNGHKTVKAIFSSSGDPDNSADDSEDASDSSSCFMKSLFPH